MMRAIAMEALKAVYRYARIPLDRFRPSEEPLRVLFVRRAPKEVLRQYFPGERVRSRDGGPSRWEFYTKWAPWLLASWYRWRARGSFLVLWADVAAWGDGGVDLRPDAPRWSPEVGGGSAPP